VASRDRFGDAKTGVTLNWITHSTDQSSPNAHQASDQLVEHVHHLARPFITVVGIPGNL
jgi:hypothetical protein